MKAFLAIVALFSVAAAVSQPAESGWRITKSMQNGHTSLLVKAPGKEIEVEVANSPYDITHYAISDSGQYIAYVSKERADPELFMQQLTSGYRLSWAKIMDITGKLEFVDGSVSYESKSERIIVKLEEVSKRLKDVFGV